MTSSPTPAPRCRWFPTRAPALGPRSGRRLAALFLGPILAGGREALGRWIRAAGRSNPYRRCYAAAVGRTERVATRSLSGLVEPSVADTPRLVLALDDPPTPRYGPEVQGAGVHRDPTPGPAGGPFVYGHVGGVLGRPVTHPLRGPPAPPRLARPCIRRKDLDAVAAKSRPAFATERELAVASVRGAYAWLNAWGRAVGGPTGRTPPPRCSSPCVNGVRPW